MVARESLRAEEFRDCASYEQDRRTANQTPQFTSYACW